ncbi:MAG: efflux RND transporter periplasmic adaptor subunit [Rhodanobacteraceae bacterium]
MNARSSISAACLLALIAVLPACRSAKLPEGTAAPAVTVATPRHEPVVDYLELTGTVSASRTVNLVARVSGYLESVDFSDGAYVEKGQLLFSIEPKPYEQEVALDQAQLRQAQSEYDRQLELMRQNATSTASVENWLSKRDQAKAQVELAKLNLAYTKVTAPFAGRIGRRLVDAGNLVGAGGATQLATLSQLVPIHVYFNLNERDVLRVRKALAAQGKQPFSEVGKAPVQAALSDDTGYPHEGVLDFTDSSVSASTGTLQLRAMFENTDLAMFPGLFVRVRIPLGAPNAALVIPDAAVASDQQGDFVLVVDEKNIVQRRNIEKGAMSAGGRVVRNGVDSADRVIVAGLQNAKAGATVRAESAATDASAR